jgi:hypothetical protein
MTRKAAHARAMQVHRSKMARLGRPDRDVAAQAVLRIVLWGQQRGDGWAVKLTEMAVRDLATAGYDERQARSKYSRMAEGIER